MWDGPSLTVAVNSQDKHDSLQAPAVAQHGKFSVVGLCVVCWACDIMSAFSLVLVVNI